MNDISLVNRGWTECTTWENGKFEQLLYSVATDLNPDERLVKWKTCDNHLTIKSDNHYYKIYQKDYDAGFFFALIRTKLAEIYRNEFGLQWDVTTIVEHNMIYQVERRQKIRQLTEHDMSFGNLLANWAYTLKKLEKSLELDKLSFHIREHIPTLKTIKLVRDCINDYNDYGITEDGHVILFDDCDWFLAFIDKDNNWINVPYNCYPCQINGEQFHLVPNRWKMFKSHQMFLKTNERSSKWTLLKNVDDCTDSVTRMLNARDHMLDDNISVLIDPEDRSSVDRIIAVTDEFNIDNNFPLEYQNDKAALDYSNQ